MPVPVTPIMGPLKPATPRHTTQHHTTRIHKPDLKVKLTVSTQEIVQAISDTAKYVHSPIPLIAFTAAGPHILGMMLSHCRTIE